MNKVLVTYATMSGSTTEVAHIVGEEITGKGFQVDIFPLENITDLTGYDAIIIGAPMIMGWHRTALKFLRKHRAVLTRIPLAVFAMAMSLVSTGETDLNGLPVTLDANLAKRPRDPGRLSFRERYASVSHYTAPILKACGSTHPVSVAFFGGSLDYRRLKLLAMLFVMLVVRAQPGDLRNWPAIRSWAAGLPVLFNSCSSGK